MKEQGQRAVDGRVCCGGWCCRQSDSVPGFLSLLRGSWNFTVTPSCSQAVLLTACIPTLLGWACFLAKLATLSQRRKKRPWAACGESFQLWPFYLDSFPLAVVQISWADVVRQEPSWVSALTHPHQGDCVQHNQPFHWTKTVFIRRPPLIYR